MPKGQEGAYNLLDLAANDDLASFEDAVNTHGAQPLEASTWYYRHYALRTMGSHAVTPVMLASLYGSLNVLKFILSHISSHGRSVNMTCSADKSTPLHYAVAGCSPFALDAVKLLLWYGADVNAVDALGVRPLDVMSSVTYRELEERVEMEKLLVNGTTIPRLPALESTIAHPASNLENVVDGVCRLPSYSPMPQPEYSRFCLIPPLSMSTGAATQESIEKAKNCMDHVPTDAKNSIYSSDDFRMFSFKVRQCSRAYSHDWTECPFVHNGENARRRDPRKFHYSCVPCPDFRKGACRLGDACEYAHGIFESWLHPAQYRTRLCKDGMDCTRRVCFFAHAKDELRPLYISNGSAVPSPRGLSMYDMNALHGLASPSSLCFGTSPLSQVQKPKNNSSCLSPEPKGFSIPPDVPTLHLPNAGSLHASQLRVALKARDACMAKDDLLNKSVINPVDRLFSLEDPYSPSSQALPALMPSLLATPLLERTQPHICVPLQEYKQPHQDTPLQLPLPSQVCSTAQRWTHSKDEIPCYCGISSIAHLRPSAVSLHDAGSPRGLCCLESETPRSTMGSRKPMLCPSTAPSLIQSHRFSISDWGSPTGKLEWGVQREDLHRLRRLSSNGPNIATEQPAFCATFLSNVCKEGGYDTMSTDESDSVLGSWLEQMQLDEITI